jgi:hypothetical protein
LHEILHLPARNQNDVIEPIDNAEDQERLQTLLHKVVVKSAKSHFDQVSKHFSFGVGNGIILGILVTFSFMFILSYFGRFNILSDIVIWIKQHLVIWFYKFNWHPLPEKSITKETFFNIMITFFIVLWALLLIINIFNYSGKKMITIGSISFNPFSFPGMKHIPILGSLLLTTIIWVVVFVIINLISSGLFPTAQPAQPHAPELSDEEKRTLDEIIGSGYLTDFNLEETEIKKEANRLRSLTEITQEVHDQVVLVYTRYTTYLGSKDLILKLMDVIVNSTQLNIEQNAYDKDIMTKAQSIIDRTNESGVPTPADVTNSKKLYSKYNERIIPIESFRDTSTLQKISSRFQRSQTNLGY